MGKARSAPKTTYEPSREQVELEKIREDNHRRGLQKLDQTRTLNQHFLQAEKSSQTQHKLTKIMEERDKNLQFDHFRANPPPKTQVNLFLFSPPPLKLHFSIRQTKYPLN
jgi:hypothetical protein